MFDGVDVKASCAYGIYHIFAQHQMHDISRRDQNALLARESARTAQIEKTLDLFVDTADCLHLTILVYRARHRQPLAHRCAANGREQSVEFSRRSAVAVDATVGLLKDQTSGQRQWLFRRVAPRQKTTEDQHALRVSRPAHFHLALDIEHFATPHAHARRNAAGTAKRIAPHLHDGEAVNLPNNFAAGVDEYSPAHDLFAHLFADAT